MKVIVLGSGVIGVSLAYELAGSGHEVIVVDRQTGAGMETSRANAGEVSPGYSAPWAGPGVPLKAIRWLLMRHRPLVLRPRIDAHLVAWCIAMLRNCNIRSYRINKARMVRLAEYSRDCLRELRQRTAIRYDERMLGTLQLFRSPAQLLASAADVEVLRAGGVDHELLDVSGCIAREPALSAVREKFVGGLRLPGDETGDCFMFTQALARLAAARGVEFRYGTAVERLLRGDSGIDGVQTSAGALRADAYVVALGSYSPLLLRPLGIRLPV
jgi:D-amino-acid dehydrogenase